jgi:hypothetical protein
MVGLNSVVVKSHGGTDALGFAHAVDVAMNMVTHGFTAGIAHGLAKLAEQEALAAAEAAPPEAAGTDPVAPDAVAIGAATTGGEAAGAPAASDRLAAAT